MIKTIAVTGATGFLGSHLVNYLITKGYNVRCITRSIKKGEKFDKIRGNLKIQKIDWNNKNSIREAIKGVEVIVHAAAIHPERSMQNKEAIFEFNVEGTRRLLESVDDNLERFIMVSSMRSLINKNSCKSIFYENSIYNFEKYDTPYGLSKFLSEKVCIEFMKEKELPLVIINPTAIIGPDDLGPSPNGKLITSFLNLPVLFTVNTNFGFVDVRDVARAIEKLFWNGEIGQRYILCVANWPLKTFIKKVLQTGRIKKPIVTIPMHFAYFLAMFFESLQSIWPDMPMPLIRSSIHFAKLNPIFDGSRITRLGFSYTDPDETVTESVKWFLKNNSYK